MWIPVIYQDADLVVVNKPAGLPTHPDDAGEGGFDVVSLLRRQPGLDYLGIHHRLDREVSGVLVFAARKEANAGLARLFEGREVEKEYRAIVRGRLPRPEGKIDVPIAPAGSGVWQVARPGDKGSKPALTHYRVEAADPTGAYSLVSLKLETGRTHQLRLHLAYLGCPIIGDPLYGAVTHPSNKAASRPAHPGTATNRAANRAASRAGSRTLERPEPSQAPDPAATFPRLLLHAYRLTFAHPTSGQTQTFEAPLPPLFRQAAEGKPLPALDLAQRLVTLPISNLKPSDRPGLLGLLELAAERRAPFNRDQSHDPETTAYRLVNGLGDGLPGITLDRYGDSLVLNCYDPRLDPASPALKLLVEALGQTWSGLPVFGKFRPQQASNLSRREEGAAPGVAPTVAPELPLGATLQGTALAETTIRENGLTYLIRPGEGLSPGLFLDMREARARLAGLVAGKTVLNCFAFTGAFGLVAAKNGASRALNLDAGAKVLDWAKENYRLNGLTPDDFDFVTGDVFDWLNRFARRGQTFDVVILDPPSFSTVKKSRWSAEKDSGELAALAAKSVAPGGLLVACTNHAGLPRRNFRQMVTGALEAAGRPYEIQGYYHEPELDFPRPAGTEGYLKILFLRLA
ncbi:MAG: class I SAM-dependent methyltransferase [Chloroflexi bacterium]|nr:class I SAM-dependent methyltransferase [Chloroflexota bacterium]